MSSSYVYSPNIVPSLLAALVVIVLAIYSIYNRRVPGAVPFAAACLFALLWSLGMVFESAAIDLGTKIFWRRFSVMWQLPSATAITCFLLEYARPKRWLSLWNLFLLSFIPLLTMITIITNSVHHLFWEAFFIENGLVVVHGPLTPYFFSYSYFLTAINLIVLTWLFIRYPQNRWPVVIVLIGQIVVRFFYFSDYTGQTRFNIPNTAVGMAILSLAYALVLFRFQILGPIPFAREVVLGQLPLGILVLDRKNHVKSINPAAKLMLTATDNPIIGKPIGEWLPAFPPDPFAGECDHRSEFKFPSGNVLRDYEMNIIQLKDWRNLPVGKLLLLADVTEQHLAQTKILEQQRALAALQERDLLARELHDDLAQVLAFIDTQGQTVRRLLNRGDLEKADHYLARLIVEAQGGEVDLRDSIQAMRLSLEEQGLIAKLAKHLDQFEQSFNIRTNLVTTETFDDTALSAMVQIQLLRILQEALTNARKHAQATQVWIKFDVIPNAINITVGDDGRGFDPVESRVDPEKHFGLQMMRERADSIGGKIQVNTWPGKGTEIMLWVPLEESQED